MPLDVTVIVKTDAKPLPAEAVDILLLSTGGAKPLTTYRSIEAVEADYAPNTVAYKQAAAIFNQFGSAQPAKAVSKILIAGVAMTAAPTDAAATAAEMVAHLNDLRQQDDDWYAFLTDQTGDQLNAALAAWSESTEPSEAFLEAGIEDHRKLYFFQTINRTPFITNRRAIGVCVADLSECADAAYLGNVAPYYPLAVTWKFKRPFGVTVPPFKRDERDALIEGSLNFMTSEYKHEYMKEGVCCDGEYIDVQMGADWIARHMREELYAALLIHPKIPYTDEGFAIVGDAVLRTLNRAVELGIIALQPESKMGLYRVTIPRRRSATDDQARARRMPDITWEAELEGAVHSVKVKGVLRATLKTDYGVFAA